MSQTLPFLCIDQLQFIVLMFDIKTFGPLSISPIFFSVNHFCQRFAHIFPYYDQQKTDESI